MISTEPRLMISSCSFAGSMNPYFLAAEDQDNHILQCSAVIMRLLRPVRA
jgi:hypothetical protein